MPKRWTINALAQELQVDRNALTRRLKGLEPKDSSLRSNGATVKYFEMADVLEHLLRDAIPDDPEKMAPKDRLDYYKGCRERDAHRKESGELLHVDDVTEAWTKIVGITKSRLLALPMRLAPDLVAVSDLREIEEAVKDGIVAALEDLADTDAGSV